MTIQKKRIFASILFVLISNVCIAQGPVPPPPPGLPIDEYLPIFFVLAFYYGIRSLVKAKQKL